MNDVNQSIERILQHYLSPSPSGITSDSAALPPSRMASSSTREVGVREIPEVDRTDGVSAEFADWRFNLRGSNTEPLLRLNVESRGDTKLMEQRTAEIAALIGI